jgi:hypothetical protein
MISTVQTSLPIFAQTVPNTRPALCAPSPESLTISTMCSGTSPTRLPHVPESTLSEDVVLSTGFRAGSAMIQLPRLLIRGLAA